MEITLTGYDGRIPLGLSAIAIATLVHRYRLSLALPVLL